MDKDYLTGLLTLKDYILQGTELVNNTTEAYTSVSIDVSNFKYLNDIYGIEGGDNAIKIMADTLFIDKDYCVLAAHTIGDQFRALFRMGDNTIEEEVEFIKKLCLNLEKVLSEHFPNVYLHIYAGAYKIDRNDFDMRIAIDKAHFAKKQIKGNFQVTCNLYRDEEFRDFTHQMNMVRTFEKACANDGIKVFFQPKFDYATNTLIGAEALCRMEDEEGNLLSPGSYIPILEKNGMMGHLDEIVMKKSLSYMKKWFESGLVTFPLSINMSRMNFYNPDIVKQIIEIQKESNVPSEFIELEVTETTFIEDLDTINNSINELRSHGFRISVDDFGSGYSSLGLITSIPADTIKLDCSFARQSLKSTKGIKIVKSVISMLKSINFDIICEGIETNDEATLITDLGCNKIQGFLYDKPLPAIEFEQKYIYKTMKK